MGLVVSTTEHLVHAPAERVSTAIADYPGVRARILPTQYSEYRVESGGQGAGTRVHWKLAATEKRVRDQTVVVTQLPDGGLVESDANSSMVTTWTVEPAGATTSTVRVRATWNGAGGIGGFFERTFAPTGLQRIHTDLLGRLDRELAGS